MSGAPRDRSSGSGADRLDWGAIEETIAEFEGLLNDGGRPEISDFLPPDGPARRALLPALVAAELEARQARGEAASESEYRERFPELERPADPAGPRAGQAWLETFRVDPPPESPRRPTARRLGRFELLEEVGRGAFGVVYRAWDGQLCREVAVKVLHGGELAGADARARFRREARSVARLSHPGLVPVFETGIEDGSAFLVGEFVAGTTLSGRLSTGERPSPRESARLAAEVADALHHAHRCGVVHRDVKPSNILIGADGRPRLTDFGLARIEADATLTRPGEAVGTPSYMSPEQARGELPAIGPPCDVYSLGAVLYELLTGHPPFVGANQAVFRQILEDDPTPMGPGVPTDLGTICLTALAKEPSLRYPSADAMAEDLRRHLRGEPVQARRVGPLGRLGRRCRRRPTVAALALVLGVTVLGSFGTVTALWLGSDHYRREAERHLAAVERQHRQAVEELKGAYRAIWHQSQLARVAANGSTIGPGRRKALAGEAIAHARRFVVDSELSDDPTLREERAALALHLAEMTTEVGSDEEAIDAYLDAVRMAEPLATDLPDEPRHRRRLALVLLAQAQSQLDSGRPREGDETLRRADRLVSGLISGRADHPAPPREELLEVARLGLLLAQLQDRRGRPGRAVDLFRQVRRPLGRAIRERPSDGEARALLARLSAELARLARHEEDPSAAIDDIRIAVDSWEEAVSASPLDESSRRELAGAELLHSELLRRADRPEEARSAALRALAHFERIASGRGEDDPAMAVTMAHCSAQLGAACYDLGRWDESLRAQRRAARCFGTLPPEWRRERGHRVTLGTISHNIGRCLHELGRLDEAEAAFRDAIALRAELAGADPSNPDRLSDLGGTRHRLGLTLAAQGRGPEAESAFERAIAHQLDALRHAPDDSRFLDLLADHRAALASLMVRSGRMPDANTADLAR
ncbi:serine/threonine-protein kinase [Tautonia plasticadhaerens]|uniref:Serine/threonine-protein kinase PknB n=1 Tax=Tautonia plasticadhaerens TaxID=2527974 RepID=A0A518GZD1_9BACT|nr:serine/threonine-protein kinase [Tautonia plasticadhaerens]QDV33954.1 Serine/threonine-protein kinase PknB [Tautonia plasticadhaerens]